jgi:hypothetical protein
MIAELRLFFEKFAGPTAIELQSLAEGGNDHG